MSIRGLVVALIALAAAGLAWQKREPLQAWLGTSRAQVAASLGEPTSGAGAARKCVKGGQITYSNAPCPAGHQEQAVSGGTVTVVPATPVAPPAEAGSGPSALHKALGVTRDDSLKDKMIEQAIEKSTR